MNIVLIGCGTIGRTILEELSKEGHTITIIDEDKENISETHKVVEIENAIEMENAEESTETDNN